MYALVINILTRPSVYTMSCRSKHMCTPSRIILVYIPSRIHKCIKIVYTLLYMLVYTLLCRPSTYTSVHICYRYIH